jgi:hypothetical protein
MEMLFEMALVRKKLKMSMFYIFAVHIYTCIMQYITHRYKIEVLVFVVLTLER